MSPSPAELWVVIPARNEAPRIGAVLEGLRGIAGRIFVVDDGSTDATAEIVSSASDPLVRLLQNPVSRGVGAAIAQGISAAIDEAEGVGEVLIAVMAGDGQMDPADLTALCGAFADPEVAVAWGDRLGGPTAQVMPKDRAFAIRVLSALTRGASGDSRLKDSQCGYVVLRASSARRLDWAALHPTYGYPNDLAIRLAGAGLKVAHVPVRAVYRGEPSGIRPLRDLPRIGWILLRGICARVWGQDPSAFTGCLRRVAQLAQLSLCSLLIADGLFPSTGLAALRGGLVLILALALCTLSGLGQQATKRGPSFSWPIRGRGHRASPAEPLGRSARGS